LFAVGGDFRKLSLRLRRAGPLVLKKVYRD
jgi:hypothetical protein